MRLRGGLGALLLLLNLEQECAVDVRQNTTKGNRGVNEGIKFLVTSDGELQVSGCNALDLEILCGVACQFEDFGSQVFEDGRQVDGRLAADARLLAGDGAKVTLYATAGELSRQKIFMSARSSCIVVVVGIRGVASEELRLSLIHI